MKTATFKVTKDAPFHVFSKLGKHFDPFFEYKVENKGSDGDYDIFTGPVPYTFHYELGGRGSSFLKQAQYIQLDQTGMPDNKITITIDAEPLDVGHTEPFTVGLHSVYFNLNDEQHLRLKQGDTFNLLPIRVWQAQVGLISNYFLEPDYHEERLGSSASLIKAGSPGQEYYALTGTTPGVSVVRVTYDPIVWYGVPFVKDKEEGQNPNYHRHDFTVDRALERDQYFNAIDPIDTGVVVVNVASAQELAALSEDIKTNIDQREYDTIYFDREKTDHAEYSFKPEAKTGDITVRVHKPIHAKEAGGVEWGEGWSNGVKSGDEFIVKLYEGRNIVEVGASGVTLKKYHVVNARGVKINVENATNPGHPFQVGDRAEVSFEGLQLQLAKIAGIYNPGYGGTNKVRYETSDGRTVESVGTQYSINQTQYNRFEVELKELGNLRLINGTMPTGHIGKPLGSHRIKVGTGVSPNLAAPELTGVYCTLPDITIHVGDGIEKLPPTITTASLPNAIIGKPYSQKLAASGATPITWTLAGTLPDGLTFDTVTGTISGTPTKLGDYKFTAEATNEIDADTKQLSISVREIAAPGKPTALKAAPGNGRVTLTWSAPADDGGGTITKYEVSVDDGAWTAATGTSHVFSGLTNGTTYKFSVRAVNEAGESAAASVTAAPSATDAETPDEKPDIHLADEPIEFKPTHDDVEIGTDTKEITRETQSDLPAELIESDAFTFDENGVAVANISAVIAGMTEGMTSAEVEEIDTGVMVPLPLFETNVSEAGKTGVITFEAKLGELTGIDLDKISVIKLKRDGSSETLTQASSLEDITDGQYIWTNKTGGAPVAPGPYFISIAVKDDGAYDCELEIPNKIVDPIAFAAKKTAKKEDETPSSGGGCATGVLGALAILALVIGGAAVTRRNGSKA